MSFIYYVLYMVAILVLVSDLQCDRVHGLNIIFIANGTICKFGRVTILNELLLLITLCELNL